MRTPANLGFVATSRRAQERIKAFISKNQGWHSARWLSFKAVVEHCAKQRTTKRARAGERGATFAYEQLARAVYGHEFETKSGKSTVRLLVPHGREAWTTITALKLRHAELSFDRETFRSGYIDQCWAPRSMVENWFKKREIALPWSKNARGLIKLRRGRPERGRYHDMDVEIIDRIIELIARGYSENAAATLAIKEMPKQKTDFQSQLDRVRHKLAERRVAREKSKR